MSSSESDTGEKISSRQESLPTDLKCQDMPNIKIVERAEGRVPSKKARLSKEGRVMKPKPTSSRSSRPASRSNSNRYRESKSERSPATHGNEKDENSFYRGALLGSFLGATLTTVVTNLVAKALQNG